MQGTEPLGAARVNSPWGTMVLLGTTTAITQILFPTESKACSIRASNPIVLRAAQQLSEYFAGTRTTFTLPLDPAGTDFQKIVWNAIQGVPFGHTITYGELAHTIGRPRASRAVGQALGRNPIPIVVPCHRVLSHDGDGGYSGGIDSKRALLQLESAS